MSAGEHRKFKFIGCEIVYREVCYLAATGPHQVDLHFLPKGLHDLETSDMLGRVQQAVDEVAPDSRYEAILLGYARCNDGLVGLTARDIPLVIPRAHDCITFFFGSRETYREQFDAHPGTYYMTSGWSERDQNDENSLTQPAFGTEGIMGKLGMTETYEQLIAKHGKENADYILETLGDWKDWEKNYSRMLYLEMNVCDESVFIDRARKIAQQHRWEFEQRKGDWTLLKKLFYGNWDDDFVIVNPTQRIVARNDENILDVEG